MQFLELNWFEYGLRVVMGWICSWLYPLIARAFELFVYLSKVNLLEHDDIKPIYVRITVVLTIIMTFYVTFEFVKHIVQPDGVSDKEKGVGKLVYKLIAVVVLIAFVPKIFGLANTAQQIIVERNIIGKIILGSKMAGDYDISEQFGNTFASSMLSNFYGFNEAVGESAKCDDANCHALVAANFRLFESTGNLIYMTTGLKDSTETTIETDNGPQTVETANIRFDGIFAVLIGGFILYIIAMYCIDVGVRWAQLIFLQIIAPIPIIGYLTPSKDGIFQKWCKQCLTTYLDLFIRIALIYFILLLTGIIMHGNILDSLFSGLFFHSSYMKVLVEIILILGLLLFAQKAPKMLGELFPKKSAASGNFGLGWKERGIPQVGRVIGGVVGGAAGVLAGGVTGAVQGWRRSKAMGANGEAKGFGSGLWGATKGIVRGTVGGATRGIYNGAKKGNIFKNTAAGIRNQAKANQRFGNREEHGYTLGHQIGDKARGAFGLSSRTQNLEKDKAPLDRKIKEHEAEEQHRKKIGDKSFANAVEKGKGRGDTRVNDAVKKYNTLDQKERALTDPNSATKQEYQAGRVKHDKVSREEYNRHVTERNSKINSIDINQIKNGITLESLGIDRSQFKSENSYNEAVERAKTQRAEEIKLRQISQIDDDFNKNVQQYVYGTQEEANAAHAAELNEVRAQKKKAKDEVSYAYEDWALKVDANGIANDQELADYVHAREEENRLYNLDAAADNQIDRESQIQSMMLEIARKQLEEAEKAAAANEHREEREITEAEIRQEAADNVSRAQAEDDWLKQVSSASKTESLDRLREIAREQENIKYETEGSGINEGKK